MNELQQNAYAKINLMLDITGRRADGYHLVQMVMQSIALHDDVTVQWTGQGTVQGEPEKADICQGHLPAITLFCDEPSLPTDSGNLAYQAAMAFFQYTGMQTGHCTIWIAKHIPLAAGLAGGSADAAATLHALNTLCHTRLSTEALCQIGLQVGADVPYCLLGGTRLAEGIGEVLSPLPALPHTFLVLCKPPVSVLTPAAYRAFDALTTVVHPDSKGFLEALAQQDMSAICARLANVLEEAIIAQYPAIDSIKATLREQGASGTLMSGSGPTVYGFFADKARAEDAARVLAQQYRETFVSETVPAFRDEIR